MQINNTVKKCHGHGAGGIVGSFSAVFTLFVFPALLTFFIGFE